MLKKNILPSLVFLEDKDIKEVKLKGIDVLLCDKLGRNTYIYPYEVVEEAVKNWKEESKHDNSFRFIFARHPKEAFGDEEDYVYLAGLIDDLYLDKETKTLKADVTLLKTVFGQLIKYLLGKGIKVGTSIRGKVFATPVFIDFNKNGKNVKIKAKKVNKLLLTGFDFVTFPSFIVTGASPEHVVKEKSICPVNLIEDFIISHHINNEEILCKLYGLCEIKNSKNENDNIFEKTNENKKTNISKINIEKGDNKMGGEKDIELLELKKQNLKLELENLENKKKEYEKLIEKLRNDKEKSLEELEKIRKEHEGLLLNIANLKKQINDLETKKENLLNSEDVFEKARITEVEYKGKKYSLDDPPRIRIVLPSERVDETPWGEIDKNMIRKLVYLSQKARIAKEAFALVKDGWKEDWKNNLKYPHHNLLPSKDPDYDLDLVLNYDGLIVAYKYLMGARGAGYYLSPEDRRKIARHLLKHFRQLKRAGYDIEIPEILKNIAESTYAIETEIPVISEVFDTLVAKGLIKVDSKKSIDIDLDDDIEIKKDVLDKETEEYILAKFAQTIFNTIAEKTMSNEFFNIISQSYEAWKGDIENPNEIFNEVMKILYGSNEAKSTFANLMNITSKEEAVSILNNILTKLNSDTLTDKLSALEQIKTISIVGAFDLIDTEEIPYNFDDVESMLYLVYDIFNEISYTLENFEQFKNVVNIPIQQTKPQETPENIPPQAQSTPQPSEQSQTPPSPPNTQPSGEETVLEKIQNEEEETVLEKIQNEGEEEMYKEKLEKIYELLEENLEVDEEITLENVEDIIGKLISGLYKLMDENETLKEKVKNIEFKEYKERKKKELMKEGISANTIENAFEKAKNIEDIDIISEVLLNETKDTINIIRKGKISSQTIEPKNDKFDKIFKRI